MYHSFTLILLNNSNETIDDILFIILSITEVATTSLASRMWLLKFSLVWLLKPSLE